MSSTNRKPPPPAPRRKARGRIGLAPTVALTSPEGALAADKAAALALTPVSRETEVRLDRYVDLLQQWQAKINLVAPSTLPLIWTRHVADSLQLVALTPGARIWVDLGSGGGFPGIVLACVAADHGGHVHLVERNARKAAFLREALRVTGGAGSVHHAEIGDYVDSVRNPVDCVTARALAPLNLLLQFSAPLIGAGARALFPKGQDVEAELTEATKYWKIAPVLHPSRTGDGQIVEIDEAEFRSVNNAALQHGSR
jgi:16S rRNA (guanine527-N7)-methyltransferase